jgi:replicative DNA helicase
MEGNIKAHPALLSIFASRLPGLQKKDGSYWANCIFHAEKTPSLTVGKDDSGSWCYHCFGCGVGGDVIQFVEAVDKISFTKAKDLVEKVTGGSWEEAKKKVDAVFKRLEIDDSKPARRYSLDEYVKFEIGLYESSEAKDWLFRERGITYETARKLHFGYCKDLAQLNSKPRSDFEPVKEKGWIITPAVEGQEVVAIEARSMVAKQIARKPGMDYKILWGTDFISWEEPVYVVEGKFDQAVLIQAGYRAVSLSNAGTKIPPQQRDILMSASVIILAGDNDGGAGTDTMIKLWNELQERTYLLIWPKGKKDANQTFLETCDRNIDDFRRVVDSLTLTAYSNPSPGIRSIQDILKKDQSESAESREDRFKFSIKTIDRMANIFPGAIVYISASSTGSGKTTFVLQETLRAALRGEIVLNYQTQLQPEEVGNIVTSNLLATDRNELTRQDKLNAAKRLKDVQYYVGNNPNLIKSEEILDLIEAGVKRVGATVVVVDLIHDICSNDADEYRAQTQAMRRIKLMAQKYLVVFFLVGQPRKVDSKLLGKALGNIYESKGSEAIPSESDVVYYMHRQPVKVMTEETEDSLSPEVEICTRKARSRGKGSTFTKVFFLGKIATFREIVPIEEAKPVDKLEF